jgi:hypothetical protein
MKTIENSTAVAICHVCWNFQKTALAFAAKRIEIR